MLDVGEGERASNSFLSLRLKITIDWSGKTLGRQGKMSAIRTKESDRLKQHPELRRADGSVQIRVEDDKWWILRYCDITTREALF